MVAWWRGVPTTLPKSYGSMASHMNTFRCLTYHRHLVRVEILLPSLHLLGRVVWRAIPEKLCMVRMQDHVWCVPKLCAACMHFCAACVHFSAACVQFFVGCVHPAMDKRPCSKRGAYFNSHQSAYILLNLLVYC